jgi:hypothetical protein
MSQLRALTDTIIKFRVDSALPMAQWAKSTRRMQLPHNKMELPHRCGGKGPVAWRPPGIGSTGTVGGVELPHCVRW